MGPVEELQYSMLLTSNGERERVRVLSRGEWMSGCPEGSEAKLLFSSISKLMLCRRAKLVVSAIFDIRGDASAVYYPWM